MILVKRLFEILFTFVMTIVLISGCSQQIISPKPLNDVQLENFIKDKNIKPLAVKTVGNSYTVVVFENPSEIGYYAAAINGDGNVTTRGGITNNNLKATPVWIGGSATGIPFVTVIINDAQVLDQADKILVRFDDGYEVSEAVNNKKGIIIPNDRVRNSNVGVGLAQIFDKNGKVLFKYPRDYGLTSPN